jgi:hypothetical protein
MSSVEEQLGIESQVEFSLEEQLARAETDLAILYNQFRLIVGNVDGDPYFYQNLNARSAEIAHQHKICADIRMRIGRIAVQ